MEFMLVTAAAGSVPRADSSVEGVKAVA